MPRKKSSSPASKKPIRQILTPPESAAFLNNPPFLPSPRFYRTIAFGFLAVAVILIVFVGFFTSGKAIVSLKIKPQTVKAETKMTVAEKAGLGQLAGLVVSTVVREERDFSPAGGTEVPAAATGRATIYNKTKSSQSLVATTRLLSPDNILFRLKNSVTVPAGGKVEVNVYADKPGKEGEIGPTKFTIPGLMEIKQKDIYAESEAKMTGGFKRISAVTADDLARAEETLMAEIIDSGQNRLRDSAKATSSLFSAGLFTFEKNFVKTEAKIGAVLDSFKMTAEARVNGVFYNPVDLRNSLLAKAQEMVSAGKELSGSFSDPSLDAVRFDFFGKTAEVRGEQEFLSKVSYSDDLLEKEKFLGRNKEEAAAYFQSLPWVAEVQIKTRPSWLKKIPRDAGKVEIEVSE